MESDSSKKRKITHDEIFNEDVSRNFKKTQYDSEPESEYVYEPTSIYDYEPLENSIDYEQELKYDVYIKYEPPIDHLSYEIIKYINKSYDMNDIEYILELNDSIQYKDSIIKHFKDNIDTIFGNDVLRKLFNNYYQKYLTTIQSKKINILGPNVYKHYFAKSYNGIPNFNIHLFGETHCLENNCVEDRSSNIDFTTYLDIILQNSHSFNDVYVETYKDIELLNCKENELNTLPDLTNKFKKCFNTRESRISDDGECDLFRFHYVDVRNNDEIDNNKYSYFVMCNNIYQIINSIITEEIETLDKFKEDIYRILYSDYFKLFIEKSKNLYTFIDEKNYKEIMEFFYYEILSDEVKKQYKQSYLKENINSFIRNEIKNNVEKYIINELNKIFYELFDIIFKHYTKIKNYDIIVIFEIARIITEVMEKINKKLRLIYTAKMDFYALCRIFRYFEIKKSNNQPRFIKNICVYAVSYHTELYSKFI
jgi:hypothetical protein